MAMANQRERAARTIGINKTSGGIGKIELSIKETKGEILSEEKKDLNIAPEKEKIEYCEDLLKTKGYSPEETKCLSVQVKKTTSFSSKIDQTKKILKNYEQGVYHFFYNDKIKLSFKDASSVELIVAKKNWGELSKKKQAKQIDFLAYPSKQENLQKKETL